MDSERASCLDCGAAVPAAATTCPECGYDVQRHERARLWLGAAGMVLTLSLVLAPIGLPLLWRAHHHRAAAAGTVGRRADPGVREHLEGVMRRHLGYRYLGTRDSGGELVRSPSAAGHDSMDVAHGPR